MNRQRVLGMAVRLALVGLAWCGPAARAEDADEIDEILKLERMADQEILGGSRVAPVAPAPAAEAPAMAAVASEPAPVAAPAPAPVVAPRADSAELQQARAEIVRLRQALVAQEVRHQAELQRSYYNMGCVYKAARQFDRAEAEFLRALAIRPDDAGVHYNLGILYDDDLHRKDKARYHYQKFLELAPDDKDAALVQEWLTALGK